MTFVLDASVALAWCFHDQGSVATEAVLDRLAEEEALVPSNFHLEIANSLLVGVRRRRISPDELEDAVAMFGDLPIIVDATTHERAFTGIFHLAREHALASYDAAYLDLARREALPLATRDTILAAAARRIGVATVGTE